ncbi:MAG: hypothetical protein JSU95_10190 [Betaproteobacteria bacterium]|nr:MAG: hypothetical protein JSU95_10190 [Betaproteobacteria bacterium]
MIRQRPVIGFETKTGEKRPLFGPDNGVFIRPAVVQQYSAAASFDFVTSPAVPSGMTFSRASTGNYLNSSGVLVSAAINTARFDYNAAGTCRGLLIESATSNICLRSEDFATTWTNVGTPTLAANSTVAPDGNTTASTITDSSTTAIQGKRQTITIANDGLKHTASIFIAKTVGAPTNFPLINLRLSGGTVVDMYLSINTTTGQILASSAANASIIEYPSFWRIALSATNNTSGNTSLLLSIYPAGNSTLSIAVNTAATGSAVFWGAQVEKKDVCTSYVKTTTAAVSRSADVAVFSSPAWLNTDVGTVVASAKHLTLGPEAAVLEIGDGTNNNRVSITSRANVSTAGMLVVDTGNTQADVTVANAFAANTSGKIASTYSDNAFQIATSSVLSTRDTSGTAPAMTNVYVGATGAGASHWNGWVENFSYYSVAMSDAELAYYAR